MKVSIVCLAYNHESYIKDAIEGFLMQNVNFDIEIIIHDDASTDNTATIIEKYRRKYPDIIKPIYQKENQYSKGKKVSEIAYKEATGEYIALCEGDDFWTDPNKLQKQVAFLDQNPKYSICVHRANILDEVKHKNIGFSGSSRVDRDYDCNDVIAGAGGLFATCSIVFKRADVSDLPSYFFATRIGDYPLVIHLTTIGKAYYMSKVMATYRWRVPNSWTINIKPLNKKIEHKETIIKMLNELNQCSKYKYKGTITNLIRKIELDICYLKKDYVQILDKNNRKYYYNHLSFKRKLKIRIDHKFPKLWSFIERRIRE